MTRWQSFVLHHVPCGGGRYASLYLDKPVFRDCAAQMRIAVDVDHWVWLQFTSGQARAVANNLLALAAIGEAWD